MKNPNNGAFSPEAGDIGGLTKKDYVFIEVLKALIKPGQTELYNSSVERDNLIRTATLITHKIFEK